MSRIRRHRFGPLSELAHVRALFQARAIAAIIGPAIWRTDKGDTLLLTDKRLQVIECPGVTPQAGVRVDTPSGSDANHFNRFHEGVQ